MQFEELFGTRSDGPRQLDALFTVLSTFLLRTFPPSEDKNDPSTQLFQLFHRRSDILLQVSEQKKALDDLINPPQYQVNPRDALREDINQTLSATGKVDLELTSTFSEEPVENPIPEDQRKLVIEYSSRFVKVDIASRLLELKGIYSELQDFFEEFGPIIDAILSAQSTNFDTSQFRNTYNFSKRKKFNDRFKSNRNRLKARVKGVIKPKNQNVQYLIQLFQEEIEMLDEIVTIFNPES